MTIPPSDPDDPRLTAYALGEAGEDDRRAVEKLLAESATARAEVERTRAFARLLASGYAEEQERYLAARPDARPPSNVVSFRDERQLRWREAVGPVLKAAALVAITASLVYLTFRRPLLPVAATAASSSSALSPPAVTPPLVAVNPSSQEAVAPSTGEAASDSARAAAFDQPPAVEPADLEKGGIDTRLAKKDGESTGGGLEQPRSARASVMAPAAAAPPPAIRPGKAAPAPSGAGAADKAASIGSVHERLARSVVRIRSSDGTFFGGVVLSSDGLILTAAPLSEEVFRQPCTVRLADGHELPAAVMPATSVPGWHTLQIEATALSPVTMASDAPATDAPLTAPLVNARSGALNFSHFRAREPGTSDSVASRRPGTDVTMASEAGFAFNSAGELLVLEYAAAKPSTLTRAKPADAVSPAAQPVARPFTSAERSMLQRAVERRETRP